ncbi:galactose oxidase [Aulographum hederae CBS 113979]|uniref:Galactose oxidase n=1 Tax=Aulographum hederae CBS 113979 TaxID=1176131 RepID=A0A6G1H7Y1_9PEZI|nr:galactose oxidase [Aulographum hederae CBS 113979]
MRIPLLLNLILPLTTAQTAPPPSSPEKTSWQSLPSLPHGPRQEHAVVAVNTTLYVIGGMTSLANSSVDIVEVFDTVNSSWSTAPPLPLGMNHPNAAVVGKRVWVLGGLTGQGIVAVGKGFVLDGGKWLEVEAMPEGSERGAAAGGVWKTKVFIAGGKKVLSAESLDAVSSFDTESGVWDTSLPPLPEPRDHACGLVVGDQFFVVGGRVNSTTQNRDTVLVLDLTSPAGGWKEKARMPTARGGAACAVVEGEKIVVLGGEGSTKAGARGVFDEAQVYDVGLDQWSAFEDPISCSLLATPLEEAPPYEAISYAWGDPGCGENFLCVEGKGIAVTKNLVDALRHCRNSSQSRVLWTDAACINQKDLDERSQQVAIMYKIYRDASQVLIWIGLKDQAVGNAFGRVLYINEVLCKQACITAPTKDPGLNVHETDVDVIMSIYNRPWFERLWVVSEVKQSKHATAMCGYHTIDYNFLAVVATWLWDQHFIRSRIGLSVVSIYRLRNAWWMRIRAMNLTGPSEVYNRG